jgi:ribonuclease III
MESPVHNRAMSGRRKRKPAAIRKLAADQSPAPVSSAPIAHVAASPAATALISTAPISTAAISSAPVVRSDGNKRSRGSSSKPTRRRKRAATALEERIGYHFTDATKLEIALTHISALKGSRNRSGSYQRLEFLGDHVLGLVISDMLYRAFPKADEGELSRRLADLVRKETCTEIARNIDLGTAIRVGSSEAIAGARSRPAILADVCEALIGAVYLDGGYKAAEDVVERLWQMRLRATAQPLRDPKTVLQEWAQARGLPTPAYREVARSGPDHSPEFRVAVQLPAFAPAEGSGRSKRAAEQAAAAAMLAREGVQPARRNG